MKDVRCHLLLSKTLINLFYSDLNLRSLTLKTEKQEYLSSSLKTVVSSPLRRESFPAGSPHHLSLFRYSTLSTPVPLVFLKGKSGQAAALLKNLGMGLHSLHGL